MYYYDFRIADLLIRVESPFKIVHLFELEHYVVDFCPETEADAYYQIRLLPENWQVQGKLLFQQRRSALYRAGNEYHRYYYWNLLRPERYVLLVRPEGKSSTLYLHPQELNELLPQLRLSAFFALEQLLLKHHAFQLHSSVIDWNGQGILFSAPSGTGKSTQAELWRKYESAQILNGDRGVIRRKDGQYRVYGSPYAGTSGIYTNMSAPVRAIVVLSQAAENRVERLTPIAAFQKLYRESTVPAWDPDFVERFSAELTELIGEVPVLHLACRPDQEAVAVLKAALSAL